MKKANTICFKRNKEKRKTISNVLYLELLISIVRFFFNRQLFSIIVIRLYGSRKTSFSIFFVPVVAVDDAGVGVVGSFDGRSKTVGSRKDAILNARFIV